MHNITITLVRAGARQKSFSVTDEEYALLKNEETALDTKYLNEMISDIDSEYESDEYDFSIFDNDKKQHLYELRLTDSNHSEESDERYAYIVKRYHNKVVSKPTNFAIFDTREKAVDYLRELVEDACWCKWDDIPHRFGEENVHIFEEDCVELQHPDARQRVSWEVEKHRIL